MLRIIIISTLSYLCFFQSYGQKMLLSNKENGTEYTVKMKKISAIGTLHGDVFEGKVRRSGRRLVVNEEAVDISEIGFLEVKKVRPEKVAAFPFKVLGGAFLIVGAGFVAVAAEGDEDSTTAGLAGFGMMASGAGLLFLGKRIAPNVKEVTVFHTKDWKFSWR